MKKSLSVLEYYSKRNLPRTLIVSAVMLAAQLVYFALCLKSGQASLYASAKVLWGIAAAAVLVLYFLLWGPSAKGSRYSYRVRMLQIPEKAVYWLNVLHNMLMFLILWGFQVMGLIICARMYVSWSGFPGSQQSVMTEICASTALLFILPLKNAAMAGSRVLIMLLLSMGAASAAVRRRYRSFPTLSGIIAAVCVYILLMPFNSYERTMSVLISSAIAAVVLGAISILLSAYAIEDGEKEDKDE